MIPLIGGGELLLPGMGWRVAAAVTLTSGVGTFLVYEWFHMTAHLPVRRSRLEQHVTTMHNQHHFRDFTRWFHVSPGGEVIAETDKAVLCEETGHGPVYYLPMTDTRAHLFRPTATNSYCPFKGEASYWSVSAGGC